MARVSGRGGYIALGGRNMSGDSRSINMPFQVDTYDATTFGFGWTQYVEGMRDVEITVDALWDTGTAATDLDATLWAMFGNGLYPWAVGPNGSASGKIIYSGTGYVTQFGVEIPVDGVVTANYTIKNSGSVTRTILA